MINGPNYLLLQEIIDQSLNTIRGYICSRPCCFKNLDFQSEHPHGFHSYVNIHKHIHKGKKFSSCEIDKYENDIKHGVFHGVMTFLAASILDEENYKKIYKRIKDNNLHNLKQEKKVSKSELEILEINWKEFAEKETKIATSCNVPSEQEKLLNSCLFHYILKCNFGEKDHDSKLEEYFPEIEKVALNHSNPKKEQEEHSLIRADRLELLRYDDSNSWVDKEKVFKNINEQKTTLLEIFYNTVRPVLEQSYEFRNERWIRHGTERHPYSYEWSKEYPSQIIKVYSEENKEEIILSNISDKDFWAIEVNKGSTGDCITGQKKPISKFEAHWQESNTFFFWELVQGKIPLKKYTKEKKVSPSAFSHRDHLYCQDKLDINQWIFTHKNINSKVIDKQLEADLKLCHEKIVKDIIKTCEKIVDSLYGVKMKIE